LKWYELSIILLSKGDFKAVHFPPKPNEDGEKQPDLQASAPTEVYRLLAGVFIFLIG
jgi:hypothetical protein